MGAPAPRVEVALGSPADFGEYFVLDDATKGELDNSTYLLAPDSVWVDVTSDGLGLSTRRGRSREVDEFQAGVATVELDNDDRTYDPTNLSGAYYTQIEPMRRMRVFAEVTDGSTVSDVPVWAGYVSEWDVEYDKGGTSHVTIEGSDGLAVLAMQELSTISANHSGDTSGARVSRVLDLAEVSFPATRSVDTGLATFGSTTFGENALQYLQRCATSENGYLFVDAGGVLTFKDRHTTFTSSRLSFSDDADGGNMLHGSASDFEEDTGGWSSSTASGATGLARTTAQAKTGDASLEMTGGSLLFLADSPGVTVTPHQSYTASLWLRAASTGRLIDVGIRWLDSTGTTISTDTTSVTDSSSAWTQATVTATAPANAATANVRVSSSVVPAGEVHYIDDATLVADNTGIPYHGVGLSYGTDLLFNRVTCTREGGTAQTVEDATSQNTYLIRTLERDNQLTSTDTEVADQARYLLGRFKDPELRFTHVEVNMLDLTAAQQFQVLSLELTDRVSVVRTPPGSGAPARVSRECIVDGIEDRVTPGQWVRVVRLASADTRRFFVFDDVFYGQLDDDLLAY